MIPFDQILQKNTAELDQEAEAQRAVEQAFASSLPTLQSRRRVAKDNERAMLDFVVEKKATQLGETLAAQDGYENTVRWLAEQKRLGEIDDEFVNGMMPVVVAQARKPIPGASLEDVAGFFKGLPIVAEDLVKGGWGILKYGPRALVEQFTPRRDTSKPTPASDVLGAATLQGTAEAYRLFQRLYRTLTLDMGDYTEDAIRERLSKDLKFYEFVTTLESGEAFPDLTEEDIEYIQSIGEWTDLTNLGPFGFGAKALKKLKPTTAALKLEKEAARKAREAAERAASVSAPRRMAGEAVETLGEVAEGVAASPTARAVIGGGAAVLGGASAPVVLATVLSQTTEAAGKLAGKGPKAITAAGRAIKQPITGPWAKIGEVIQDVGLGGVYGTAGMLPFAAVSETPEERGMLLAGGTVFGSAGAVAQSSLNHVTAFGRSFWSPESAAPANTRRAPVTEYGDVAGLDAAHASYVNQLPVEQANRVEALRQLIGSNNRLYVLPPEQFDALPEIEGKPAQGVVIRRRPDGSVAYVRGDSESLSHEVGHVVFRSLPETEQIRLMEAVEAAYPEEDRQAMRDYYESRGINLDSPEALVEEILAENFQVLLNGGPLGKLGVPRSAAAAIYDTVGTLAERVGLRELRPGGAVQTSSTLQFTPSFIVQNALRSAVEGMNLDGYLQQPSEQAVPPPVGPSTVDVGASVPVPEELVQPAPEAPPARPGVKVGPGILAPVPQELLEQSPTPVPGSISGLPQTRTPAPAPVAEAPAPAPVAATPAPQRPNVRVTRGQQEGFIPPTPEQQPINTQRLQELADRPRAQQAYVETEYFAAKPVTGTEPDAPRRLAQRQLADKAEAEYPGYSNPLRAPFQKIFAPYKNLGGNKIIGFSFDKLIQNLDILAGWVGEQITAGKDVQLPYDLSSPELRRDVQTYLQNHANGYAGDGRRLQRPADTVPGTVPDENPGYTPVPLEPVKAQFINLLMGLEPPKKTTAAAEYNRRFAEQNGLAIAETPTGSPEVNVLRAQLRDLGFDSSLLNGVLEVLRTDRIAGEIKERPDINLGVGEGAFIRAGFMPAEAAKTSPGNPQAQESKKRTASTTVRAVAEDYMREAGLPYTPHEDYAPVNEDLAKRLADFYEQSESAPDSPEVQSAYRSLADETMAQYRAMEAAGMKIEPWEGKGEPYANSAEMLKDVRDNRHLWFFTTESGFGKGETVPNALLEDSGVVINGKPLVINDIFRAVHDYFGHAKEGYEFGPRGEFNAYLAHSRMFSDAAKPALASETLAQNSWVNFGPHLRRKNGSLPKPGEDGFVAVKDRPFADQKNLVIPDELLAEADQVAGQFMPAEAAEVRASMPARIRVDDLPESPNYEVVPKGDPDPLGYGSRDKFYLSPDGRWLAVEEHERAAEQLLTGREKSRNRPGNPNQEELELRRGWVRVLDQGSERNDGAPLYFTNQANPTQLRELRNVAIEYGRELIQDFGGRERTLYRPERGAQFMPAEAATQGVLSAEGLRNAPKTMAEAGAQVFDEVVKSEGPEQAFMPASEGPLADAILDSGGMQFKRSKKKGSFGGAQALVHFSSVPMKVLDPKKASGRGAATPTDLKGLPRGYFYRVGQSAYESVVADRQFVYTAVVDGNAVYDLNADPLGYKAIANREKADQMLLDKGFVGMRGKVGAIDMVAMFEPVKVTEAVTEDVYTPRQLKNQRRGRLADEDIDYQEQDAEWQRKLNRGEPLFMPLQETREEGDTVLRVSTRLPTAVKTTENALTQPLVITSKEVLAYPKKVTIIGNLLREYPMLASKGKAASLITELMDLSVSNLLWLHDKMPPELRKRARKWYDGGRRLTERWSNEKALPRQAVAGAIAALSPQKDWYMNVDLAGRVIDHLRQLETRSVTDGIADWVKTKFSNKPSKVAAIEDAVGKTWAELDLTQKAMFLRAYDELMAPRSYQLITPEGDFVGVAKTSKGAPAKVAWGDFGSIAKAISIVEDPSKINISNRLGGEHKVRNFYNNILLPNNAEYGDVTIDTHAVAAALLSPLAGSDLAVIQNLGGGGAPGSAITGASGLYGIYADAYRKAAKERGILPREMQSITWEAVRGLFSPEFKTATNKAKIELIWKKHKEGGITLDEARTQINNLAGGITPPSWAKTTPPE